MTEITTYKTIDGKTFDSELAAKLHEQSLNDPLNVFILYSYSYSHSDTTIIGVFRSYEKAETFLKHLRDTSRKDMYSDLSYNIEQSKIQD